MGAEAINQETPAQLRARAARIREAAARAERSKDAALDLDWAKTLEQQADLLEGRDAGQTGGQP